VSVGERVRPSRLGSTRPTRSQHDRARRGPAIGRVHHPSLRGILLGIDTAAVAAAWLLTLLAPWQGRTAFHEHPGAIAIAMPAITAGSLLLIASQRLYLARVAGVRAVEVARLARASTISGVATYLVAALAGNAISVPRALAGVALAFAFLAFGRGAYGTWLKSSRASGRFSRPVIIVGTNAEGRELERLLRTHPELGFRVIGCVGRSDELALWRDDVPWLGDLAGAGDAIVGRGANGVIIAASAVPHDQLNRLTRELLAADLHVHLSTGLKGIAYKRLRSLPLAHEPLFYLEPVSLSRWQLIVKRGLDVTVASVSLLFAAPVLAIAALAIKLQDRGPVLFRQRRVGRDGRTFEVLKLRTMVPDAEDRLSEVTGENLRRDGPLFKATDDPRRTRVGRVLEATSLDELPQLINVLLGTMSLVGPRPALPDEVAKFDDELLERHSVRPGITGLWQVEARDNPSFDAYRRLDLFYVENWSVTLDLAILFETFQAVLARLLRGPVSHLETGYGARDRSTAA
jgi:exopolysaccharide biosynthesis polyprenyl glycosylphosphotransferase